MKNVTITDGFCIEGIPLITRFKTEQVNARNLVVLKY